MEKSKYYIVSKDANGTPSYFKLISTQDELEEFCLDLMKEGAVWIDYHKSTDWKYGQQFRWFIEITYGVKLSVFKKVN